MATPPRSWFMLSTTWNTQAGGIWWENILLSQAIHVSHKVDLLSSFCTCTWNKSPHQPIHLIFFKGPAQEKRKVLESQLIAPQIMQQDFKSCYPFFLTSTSFKKPGAPVKWKKLLQLKLIIQESTLTQHKGQQHSMEFFFGSRQCPKTITISFSWCWLYTASSAQR